MMPPGVPGKTLFVVLSDPSGRPIAQRYLEQDQVRTWLARNVTGACNRCDLYDEAPVREGRLIESLWLDARGSVAGRIVRSRVDFRQDPATTRNRTRLRVLVVDDDTGIRTALANCLTEHDVVLAAAAKEAIARVSAGERFDVIVCGMVMPQMSGIELFDDLTRLAPDQADRMLFVTAGAVTANTWQFASTAAYALLAKHAKVLADMVRAMSDRGPTR